MSKTLHLVDPTLDITLDLVITDGREVAATLSRLVDVVEWDVIEKVASETDAALDHLSGVVAKDGWLTLRIGNGAALVGRLANDRFNGTLIDTDDQHVFLELQFVPRSASVIAADEKEPSHMTVEPSRQDWWVTWWKDRSRWWWAGFFAGFVLIVVVAASLQITLFPWQLLLPVPIATGLLAERLVRRFQMREHRMNTGMKRLGLVMGAVASIGWLAYVADASSGFTVITGVGWIVLVGSIPLCFGLAFAAVWSLDWIIAGFRKG